MVEASLSRFWLTNLVIPFPGYFCKFERTFRLQIIRWIFKSFSYKKLLTFLKKFLIKFQGNFAFFRPSKQPRLWTQKDQVSLSYHLPLRPVSLHQETTGHNSQLCYDGKDQTQTLAGCGCHCWYECTTSGNKKKIYSTSLPCLSFYKSRAQENAFLALKKKILCQAPRSQNYDMDS